MNTTLMRKARFFVNFHYDSSWSKCRVDNFKEVSNSKLALNAYDHTLPANHSPKPCHLQNTWTHHQLPSHTMRDAAGGCNDIVVLGQTFCGPITSTDHINTFRPLNLLFAIGMRTTLTKKLWTKSPTLPLKNRKLIVEEAGLHKWHS